MDGPEPPRNMPDVTTVVYVVAFFALYVIPLLYLTWRSTQSDVHSPTPDA